MHVYIHIYIYVYIYTYLHVNIFVSLIDIFDILTFYFDVAMSRPDQMEAMTQEREFRLVDNWALPNKSEDLKIWATDIVEAYLRPLADALAPIKTSSKVASHGIIFSLSNFKRCVLQISSSTERTVRSLLATKWTM